MIRCRFVLPQVFFVLLSMLTVTLEIHAATTPRHVFYLATGSTITTYNVNSTGVPVQVGTPLTISGAPFLGAIVPSPNDHFLYVFWPDANYNLSLSVYDTYASGAPHSIPVQTLPAQGWQMMIHKSGLYAYVLQTTSGSNGYSSTLYLYHIDQTTGALTQDPKIQATYGPDYFYEESLVSFNKAGSRLYDLWSVGFDGENNYYYSYHPVNQTTGQLSPDVGTSFTASNFTGLDETYFTTSLILDLHNDNDGQPSALNVYQNVKNPQQPLFVCTQSMLNACGTAYNYWLSVDEQYVFLPETSDTAIGRIEATNKQIVQTGLIAGTPSLYFSPEDRIIYAVDGSTNVIQVYSFNSSSGTVSAAGSTTFSSTNGYSLYPALRQ